MFANINLKRTNGIVATFVVGSTRKGLFKFRILGCANEFDNFAFLDLTKINEVVGFRRNQTTLDQDGVNLVTMGTWCVIIV